MRRLALPPALLGLLLLAWLIVGAHPVFAAPSSSVLPSTPPSPSGEEPAGASPVVDIVKVEGNVDRPMADYVRATLEDAEAQGHAVLLQVDTWGTLGVDPMDLARLVHDLRVPVMVWVGPPGAHAGGLGAIWAYAADVASVSPGSGIGPLRPPDLDAEDSTLSAADLATLESWAAETGRGGVDAVLDRELTAREAIDAGVVNDVAPGSPSPGDAIAMLGAVDGRTVTTASGEATLVTQQSADPAQGPGVLYVYHDLGPWKRVLHSVAAPTAVYLLLVVAFAGLAFELTQPGFGFAGVSGLAALAFAAYGVWTVRPEWSGLVLLVVGFALLIADVQRRRLGVLTAAGMVAWAAGSFLLYPHVAPVIAISPWVIGLVLLAGFWYYGFGLTIAQQAYQRIHSTQVGLVGLTGEARGALDPEGAVYVKGTLWRGRTVGEAIAPGTKVRVRGIDGLILRVEPEPDEDD